MVPPETEGEAAEEVDAEPAPALEPTIKNSKRARLELALRQATTAAA
jgi:hypothetical protein